MIYNAEDPVKAQYVRDVIKSQVQDANNALTERLAEAAVEYLDLIGTGGRFEIFGRQLDVLGPRALAGDPRGGQGRPAQGLARARSRSTR